MCVLYCCGDRKVDNLMGQLRHHGGVKNIVLYVVFKGVPLRIEIGPRDVKADQAVVVRRDTGEKVWEQKK